MRFCRYPNAGSRRKKERAHTVRVRCVHTCVRSPRGAAGKGEKWGRGKVCSIRVCVLGGGGGIGDKGKGEIKHTDTFIDVLRNSPS